MILNKIRNKSGASIIILTIMSAILFTVIMTGLIDISNIHRTSQDLKRSLNAAVKSASTRVDWAQVPSGVLQIDVPKANNAFEDIFSENLGITPKAVNNYYEYTDPKTGNEVVFYAAIYNNRTQGTYVSFPGAGTIPTQITGREITVKADRPTVFGVATVKYKLMPILGGGTVDITQFASSELNFVPQSKQKSATYK